MTCLNFVMLLVVLLHNIVNKEFLFVSRQFCSMLVSTHVNLSLDLTKVKC